MSDRRLYLDESGDHTARGVTASQWEKRYLCLFGCALERKYCHETFHPSFEEFKTRHFGGDQDDPVIMHREDLVSKRGCFAVLQDRQRREAFDRELLEVIQNTRFTAFAVVIDKLNTQGKRFGPMPSHPYHIGLLGLLERYCGMLRFHRDKGDVFAESRGGREDLQLKAAYRTVYTAGTRFHPKDDFQSTLTSKEIKIKPKTQNIGGLQLADLLAYPAKRGILYELGWGPEPTAYTKRVIDVIERKYNARYATGQKMGYGKILLV